MFFCKAMGMLELMIPLTIQVPLLWLVRPPRMVLVLPLLMTTTTLTFTPKAWHTLPVLMPFYPRRSLKTGSRGYDAMLTLMLMFPGRMWGTPLQKLLFATRITFPMAKPPTTGRYGCGQRWAGASRYLLTATFSLLMHRPSPTPRCLRMTPWIREKLPERILAEGRLTRMLLVPTPLLATIPLWLMTLMLKLVRLQLLPVQKLVTLVALLLRRV